MSLSARLRVARDSSVTVASLVDDQLARCGDCSVGISAEGPLTLAGLHREVAAIDAFLSESLGLQPGQLVAIYRTNDHHCFRWFLAIIRAGGVAVPLDPQLSLAEVRRILTENGVAILVTDTAIFASKIGNREALPVRCWIQADLEAETLPGFSCISDLNWQQRGLGAPNRLGMIRLVGRMKDVIKSGGHSVYVHEREEALLAHPSVARAAAFGLPHAEKDRFPRLRLCCAPLPMRVKTNC